MVAEFSSYELHQDFFLGACFLLLSVLSGQRLYHVLFPRGRKVIIVFNFLIFLTAVSRAIWFFLPNYYLEPSYFPKPVLAFHSYWEGVLVSEAMLALGNLTFYGSFIVIACYWSHILQKLRVDEPTSDLTKHGTLWKFSGIMIAIATLQLLNIIGFLSRLYNSQAMVLIDCLLYSVLAVIVALHIAQYSKSMREVIEKMEMVHRSTSQAQARRIYGMMLLAVGYFTSRVVCEVALGLPLLSSLTAAPAKTGSAGYWIAYIFFKHGLEALAMGLQLLVSTAIKSYEGRGSYATRHSPHPIVRPPVAYLKLYNSESSPLLATQSSGSKPGGDSSSYSIV